MCIVSLMNLEKSGRDILMMVRGSMEIRRVLDRTVRRNIFVCVTREHKGANIGQKRFDLIRQAAESAISKLVPNINK